MQGMVPDDLHALTWAADPRLSPDGRTVAYVVAGLDREANEYRSAIWLAAADGSSAPARFTAGERRDAVARWSPEGSRLAFVSNRERDAAQLYVIPAAGGEARRLTDLPEPVRAVAWSPDGTRIAFVSRVPAAEYEQEDQARRAPRRITRLRYRLDDEGWTIDRPERLFVVPADGSAAPRRLIDGDAEESAPAWSPDGRTIAFVSARHPDWDLDEFTDVYLVDADGGEPRRLTPTDAARDLPSWSPDGAWIAHLYLPVGIDDFPRHGQVALVGPATGELRVLTGALDRNCCPFPTVREPAWVGDEVLFALEDHGDTPLYRVRADGRGAPQAVTDGGRAVTGFDAAGGRVVHAASTPTCPGEVWSGDARLTDVTGGFRSGRALVEPERFTARSADGTEVDAWLVRPPGPAPGRRIPTLLTIHGGPFTQYGSRFLDEFQVYAGAGYAVIYCNPRGSSGYGEEFARAIRVDEAGDGGLGTVDADDVTAVVDEALRRFEALDPERLGVLGGSYGGFMTTWLVGHTDRFRAAVSERAVNQWVSFFGSSDEGPSFRSYLRRYPYEDPTASLRCSPATYARDIRTPVLILHSEDDLRCDIEQAQHLFAALRLQRREVEMVRFPAEGHELSRSGSPAHRVMRFEVILEWFARHLGTPAA